VARILTAFLILSILGACVAPGRPTETDVTTEFRVIGYATDASIPEIIQYDKLTHINYAFLIPNEDGTFAPMSNTWKLDAIVTNAHEQGAKVLISVGGWGWDAQFEALAADPAARARAIEFMVNFIEEKNLDGVDMDWEYPDAGESSQNFLKLMTELRAALPEGKLLTAAVVSGGDFYGAGIPVESFELMDFVNLMAYDGDDHGTMAQAESSLDYWLGRGLPAEKAVLGLPFYSRPSEVPYREIVAANPDASQIDDLDHFGTPNVYNGVPTIQAKTRLAMERASGVMFWNLDHDAQGELSLLSAINAVVEGAQ
jgi:GH18 family chitinase